MMKYEKPIVEIWEIQEEDIVTTSNTLIDGGTGGLEGSEWEEWSQTP